MQISELVKEAYETAKSKGWHDCQEFDGVINSGGYGRIHIGNGKHVLAHRLAWALHNGADPCGYVVMHRCDNPPCVNPEHLVLGSQKENIMDMDAKGRRRAMRGQSAGGAKFSDTEAEIVRKRVFINGEKRAQLAREYGVSKSCIGRIASGNTYAN